jgi:protease-4
VGLDGLRKILHLLLLLLIFGAIGSLFSRPIPLIPDGAALVIAPQGPLVEQFTGDPLERAVSETLQQGPVETRLRDLVEAIDTARDDERISSLYLDLGGLDGGGTAKLQEVAAAIDRFRKSGKPVIAFGEFFDQPQYYLAAHADEIFLDPQGIAYIDGFANYGMFVKEALDKFCRLERVPCRPVQVGSRDFHTQRHVARRARGKPRVAQFGVGHVEVGRSQGSRHRTCRAAGLR